jgi:hypothetical protein
MKNGNALAIKSFNPVPLLGFSFFGFQMWSPTILLLQGMVRNFP